MIGNYIKEKEKIERDNGPNKEKKLSELKNEVTANIKLHLAGELLTSSKLIAAIQV